MVGHRLHDFASQLAMAARERLETHTHSSFDGVLAESAAWQGADGLLRPVPSMPPHEYITAIKLKCGLPVANKLPSRCTCSFKFGDHSVFDVNRHIITCPHNSGKCVTTRHTNVLYGISSVLRLYNIHNKVEPSDLSKTLRPDIHLVCTTPPAIIDFTVVDDIGSDVGKSLDDRADLKNSKYGDLAESLAFRLFPVVVNTFGSVHVAAERFFAFCAKFAPHGMCSALHDDLRRVVQSKLAQGNAQVIHHTLGRLAGRHA
jgi:hypothetical protein